MQDYVGTPTHDHQALHKLEKCSQDEATDALVETLTNRKFSPDNFLTIVVSQSGTKKLTFQQFRSLMKKIPDSHLNRISASWQYSERSTKAAEKGKHT